MEASGGFQPPWPSNLAREKWVPPRALCRRQVGDVQPFLSLLLLACGGIGLLLVASRTQRPQLHRQGVVESCHSHEHEITSKSRSLPSFPFIAVSRYFSSSICGRRSETHESSAQLRMCDCAQQTLLTNSQRRCEHGVSVRRSWTTDVGHSVFDGLSSSCALFRIVLL